MNNPYGAPDAYVEDRADEPPKRPVLVWIIFIFAVFGVISGVVGNLMLMSGHIPMANGAERTYMQSLTPFDHLLTFVDLIVYGLAALYLFRLKKLAVNLLVISGLFKVVMSVYIYMKPSYRTFVASMGTGRLFHEIGLYIGWAIVVAIIVYAFKLRRDGVLR